MSFPVSIPGLLARIEPAIGSYKDSGRTDIASSNGDPVAVATDQTGNSEPTGSNVTLAVIDSRTWFSFDGSSSNFNLLKPSAFEVINAASFTYCCALQTASTSDQDYQTFLSKTTNQASKLWLMLDDVNGGNARGWTQSQRYSGLTAGRLLPNTTQVLTYRFTATGTNEGLEEWRVNGVLVSSASGSLPSWDSASNWRVGCTDLDNYFFNGLIGPQLLYSGALSDGDCELLESYVAEQVGAPPFPSFDTSVNIVFTGNSIMDGALASSESTTLPSQAMALLAAELGHNFQYINLGASGEATEQLAQVSSIQIDPCQIEGAKNILVMWEISNSLAEDGDTAAEAYDALVSYCEARRTAGWDHIVVMSCLPRAAVEAAREEVNALLRSDFNVPTSKALIFKPTSGVTYADLLYDVGNNSLMGCPTCPATSGLYGDNAVHPNDAGYTELAPGMRDSLAMFLASLSASPATCERGEPGQTLTLSGNVIDFDTAVASDFTLTGSTITGYDPDTQVLTFTASSSTGTLTLTHVPTGAICTITCVDTTPPPAPAGVGAGSKVGSGNSYSFTLSWDAGSDTYGGSVTYRVYQNGTELTTAPGQSETSFDIMDAALLDLFSVTAEDAHGNISEPTGYTLQIPMPTNMALTTYPTISIDGVDLGRISQTDPTQFYFNSTQNLTGPVTVAISSPYTNTEIRYKLIDSGRAPNPSSALYTAPLVFTYNTAGSDHVTVRARVYDKRNANNMSKVIKLQFRIRNQTF